MLAIHLSKNVDESIGSSIYDSRDLFKIGSAVHKSSYLQFDICIRLLLYKYALWKDQEQRLQKLATIVKLSNSIQIILEAKIIAALRAASYPSFSSMLIPTYKIKENSLLICNNLLIILFLYAYYHLLLWEVLLLQNHERDEKSLHKQSVLPVRRILT